ncbi:hypothetical protein, partial [Mesorhizobium sp. M2D.F.Ca.ET.178.01.1.1]|uniref:hypothetical protein n=1 Tax=Mesorhizobium sp. M2D.F.Ca.ET.178.01.1.1 TaxID=2563937 RepID=UPI001AEE0DC4
MTSTPLAGERLRPLGHLSVAPLDKEKLRHNQQAGVIIAEKSVPGSDAASPCGDSAAIPWLATRACAPQFGLHGAGFGPFARGASASIV